MIILFIYLQIILNNVHIYVINYNIASSLEVFALYYFIISIFTKVMFYIIFTKYLENNYPKKKKKKKSNIIIIVSY